MNNTIKNFFNLDWLTGPFLDKELRVSSRHKRNYLLRAAYIALLLFFVTITWLSVVTDSRGTLTYQKSRLALAGKTITLTIVWFQFIASQVVAVVMFCNSIGDEIYHRTLGVLLTTPVTSFQIVAGKLLSKLFQIILLLAISLPLLAIVRIFGGVSWNYILSSICVTLAAVIFAGSVSMFFSVLFRKPYVVIIITILFLGIVLGISSFFSPVNSGLFRLRIRGARTSFFSVNPLFLLSSISDEMMNPGRSRIGYFWIIGCFFVLLASVILLFSSARILRSIALAHAVGQKSFMGRIFGRKRTYNIISHNPEKHITDNKIRHVLGPAVAWKEMITKFSSKEKVFAMIVIAIELIMIFAMYMFPYIAAGYGYDEAQWLYIHMFMGLGVLSTAISSAGCITSEKEAQTWPLLLLTTLSNWQILVGKFVGILKRCLPMWILLFIYFFPFIHNTGAGIISLLLMIFLVAAVIIFLGCSGLYFSARYKNTSIAFLVNIILVSAVWIILPAAIEYFSYGHYMMRYIKIRPVLEALANANPFLRARALVLFDNQYSRIINIGKWSNSQEIFDYIFLMTGIVMGYIITGFIFAWRSMSRFRKGIF